MPSVLLTARDYLSAGALGSRCVWLHPCRISGDGDDWGGGDRPEGSDDDDDDEDQEEEDQEEDRPYARPITPALESRGRRFRRRLCSELCGLPAPTVDELGSPARFAFQGTTSPVVYVAMGAVARPDSGTREDAWKSQPGFSIYE